MSGSEKKVIPKNSIEEKAIELIGSKVEGIHQSELRKQLSIESSRCSKIVLKLERSGVIRRKKSSMGNRRTYLITLSRPISRLPVKESQVSYITITDDEIRHFRIKPSHSSIDTYLTEIYLLYLMKGRDTSCHEVDLHEGFPGDTATGKLSDGGDSDDNRAVDCRRMEDRNCSADISSCIPYNGRGKLSERLLRPRDRCDQSSEEADPQRTHQLKRCSEMVVGAIRNRLRSRWPSKSILPGISSN